MATFHIVPSTNRQSKGESWELTTSNHGDALEFAGDHAPDNVSDALMGYGFEVLRGQLDKMEVGDKLTECWSMTVFEARIERIA